MECNTPRVACLIENGIVQLTPFFLHQSINETSAPCGFTHFFVNLCLILSIQISEALMYYYVTTSLSHTLFLDPRAGFYIFFLLHVFLLDLVH